MAAKKTKPTETTEDAPATTGTGRKKKAGNADNADNTGNTEKAEKAEKPKKGAKTAPEIWSYSEDGIDATIDDKVKERIHNELDRNFLVEAVPGSGKTYNLVGRMVSLVLSGRRADGIAAITFTRKAAEELRGRFRERVESRLVEAAGAEKALLEKALVTIEDGYVGTIHGFCARILREYPVEARLDPSFSEIEEADEEYFFARTWAEMLSENPEMLKPFADHEVDPEADRIIRGLRAYCRYPDIDFSCSDPLPPPDPKNLLQIVADCWRDIRSLDPRPAIIENGVDAKAEEVMKHWFNIEKLAARLQRFNGKTTWNPDEIRDIWRAMRYLADPKLSDGAVGIDDGGLFKQYNDDIKAVCKEFREAYSCYVFPKIQPVLDKIRQRERDWRNQRGYVSYLDLLSRTVELLRDNPHVRNAVQARYPVLMIDEFQDTDPLQAEMAFLLTADDPEVKDWLQARPKPGSLFLVGDPKQSVYRFRRADIQIYHQAGRHLQATGGEIISLQQNRRSRLGICGWVNRAFAPALEAQRGLKRGTFDQAGFMAMLPLRTCGSAPAVTALPIPTEIHGGATRIMADYDSEKFTDIITAMLGSSFEGIKEGQPLCPDDFLILSRKNDLLATYALRLDAAGVPVSLSGGGKTLAAKLQQDFRPLYWVLRALIDCSAAIVWAVLVGPLFGCSDEEIYEYCRTGNRLILTAPVEGESTVARLLLKLKLFRQWMQELPPGTAFRRIVAALHYDAWLQGRDYGLLKTTFLHHVEKLFDKMLFTQANDVLGSWVKHWPVDQSIDEPGRVRLMTMHSAKGLEAPVVLMGIAKRPQFKDSEVMLNRGIDDEPAPVAKGMVRLGFDFGPYQQREFICSPGWKNARPFEVNAYAAEQLRLDYVACTRARDLLIVSRHNAKGNTTLTPLSKGVEEAMNNCPEFELPAVAAETASVATTGPGNETIAEWREKRRAWRAASTGREFSEESVTESVEKAEKAELAKSNMAKNSDGGREVGTFVHKVLCNLLRWRVTTDPEDAARLELLLDHYLEDELKLQKKRPALLELLKMTLGGELWHEALQAGEFHTEVPVTCMAVSGRKRGTIVNGTIDLVFRVPGGWKIVDYKTNLINDEEQRSIFNDFYRTQLDLYASQWETITGEKVLTRSLFYVRDGREVEL